MEGYGSRTVAALTALSQRQIDYWDRTHIIKPSLAMASGRGTRRLYDFSDLVQFRVVAFLKEKGISLQKIRKCIAFLRRNMQGLARPLASLKFLTDGETIFVLTSNRKEVLDTLKEGQLVFSIAIGQLLLDLHGKIKEIERKKSFSIRVGTRKFTALLHPDLEQGGYWAECPDLPGCLSQGETIEETLAMMDDAIRGHLAVMAKSAHGRKVG
ncbi:MAG TPA: MerR family transcriptional regulator [Candidatus Deferrimicrobiaceae bacterium]|nr:MerR family transcriptional regulator [Candidatus Deferrimicrobiaceae bacterium]